MSPGLGLSNAEAVPNRLDIQSPHFFWGGHRPGVVCLETSRRQSASLGDGIGGGGGGGGVTWFEGIWGQSMGNLTALKRLHPTSP